MKATEKYGFKIVVAGNGKKTYNVCKNAEDTLKQLEYYLKFPPYRRNKTIRILDITKKEVEDGIFDKLPWYSRGTFYII